jgi:hypothetical protein
MSLKKSWMISPLKINQAILSQVKFVTSLAAVTKRPNQGPKMKVTMFL